MHITLPTASLLVLHLFACGNPSSIEHGQAQAETTADSKDSSQDLADPGTSTDQSTVPEIPGKQYFAVISSYMTVPEGMTASVDQATVNLTRSDGHLRMNFGWYTDLATTFKQMTSGGIDLGTLKLGSNGATEDVGQGRTAFVSMLMNKSDLRLAEARYHISEPVEERGSFLGFVAIDQEDDAFFEQAKRELLAVMNSVEHISAAEAATRAAEEKGRMQRKWQEDLAAINFRKRTPEEEDYRQALKGKALVKMKSESNSSSFGTDYFYSTERFELCASGQGEYSYSSSTRINGMNTENDGTRYETGTMSGNSKDHMRGQWDVSRDDTGFFLEIHTGSDAPGSWRIRTNGNDGFIVGGKKFWVAGPDSEHGPSCE